MLQNCDFVGFRVPSHILFADADIYFKVPLLNLKPNKHLGKRQGCWGHQWARLRRTRVSTRI
jgi:hypothetical protein